MANLDPGVNRLKADEGRDLISRRHPEWSEHHISWRWLMDSLEGGNRYRQAIYGSDTKGMPVRNLIRHKREYADPRELGTTSPTYVGGTATGLAGQLGDTTSGGGVAAGSLGSDPASPATIDDYELRRARTPVPTFVSEVVGIHLGKIYAEEVDRDLEAIPELVEWSKDVDGHGTTLDEWMEEVIAPLLMTLGQLDILMDHPPKHSDMVIDSQADVIKHGLNRAVASYILPENMVWWKLDARLKYAECLVKEYADPDISLNDKHVNWRHWTAEKSTLYDSDGTILGVTPHRFGRVPIERVFDRKKPRCRNVGKPRYEGIAERMREYYNRDSELILSDTIQAHPLLQGPEDYVNADGTLPVGPTWMLPKKKNNAGGAASYEGFDVIEFPKEGADSLRKNKSDIRDDVDRDGCLTKPAGTGEGGKGTVSQSGVSKQLDHRDGNALLSHIAKTLSRAERQISELALVVAKDDPKAASLVEKITIAYPTVFDLTTAEDLMTTWMAFLSTIAMADSMVELNVVAFSDYVRKALPGRSDEFYETADQEIREFIESNAKAKDMALEGPALEDVLDVDGTAEDRTEPDPDGGGDDDGESTTTTPSTILVQP